MNRENRAEVKAIDRKERLKIPKQPVPERNPRERIRDFREVSLGYTEELAVKEAMRCLQCPKPNCVEACPVHNDIPGFIGKIEERDFEGAYRVLLETTNLPDFCGRLCPQEVQCEGSCVVGKRGEPVGGGRLDSFVAGTMWKVLREEGLPAP